MALSIEEVLAGATSDPVFFSPDEGWGHFDEVWCDFHGGYETEAEARIALAFYCYFLEHGFD